MGKWNFDDIENSLVNDAEKRITRGYQKPSDVRELNPGTGKGEAQQDARGLSPDMSPDIRPASEPANIIGLKGPDTKGVQTYLPLKDYMRLMQQKTLRKQNIAQIAGEAIIDWLDRQEQK
jgi:hypothetical protein